MFEKRYIAILFVLLITLALRFFWYTSHLSHITSGKQITFTTTLLQEPSITGTSQKLTVQPNGLDFVFVTLPRFPAHHYGDTLKITGKGEAVKESKIGNKIIPLLGIKQAAIAMYFPKVTIAKNDASVQGFFVDHIIAIARAFREHIVILYRSSLPPISASLLMGIVLGVKDDLPKDFADSLRLSGVMHVVVASGMNVSMVAAFLFGLFGLVTRRQFAIILSILGIFFYAIVSGFNAPILRACIMATVAFSAQIIGRQNTGGYALILAGFLMLFVSPMLFFDVGFQLSFLATMGLLYIRPLLERASVSAFFKKIMIGDDLMTTLAAQIGTLPILVGSFGTYSLFSMLVNVLVLWTIPLLMILGALAAFLGFFFPIVGSIVLYLTLPFLLYFQHVVSFFGSQSAVLRIDALPMSVVVGYYLVLLSFVVKKK